PKNQTIRTVSGRRVPGCSGDSVPTVCGIRCREGMDQPAVRVAAFQYDRHLLADDDGWFDFSHCRDHHLYGPDDVRDRCLAWAAAGLRSLALPVIRPRLRAIIRIAVCLAADFALPDVFGALRANVDGYHCSSRGCRCHSHHLGDAERIAAGEPNASRRRLYFSAKSVAILSPCFAAGVRTADFHGSAPWIYLHAAERHRNGICRGN